MLKKILVVWSNGMLAHDFIQLARTAWYEIIAVDREECDITDINIIRRICIETNPNVILNLSAYTDVESAEDVGKKTNFLVNTLGVGYLATVAKEIWANFITISTDYVFNGEKKDWYLPTDEPNPINEYGLAKYLGEKLAKDINPDTIIIRTSWLYGWGKEYKNFVNTMLRLAETKTELKVINDQYGNPTSTTTLSNGILETIRTIESNKWQILHITDETEWDGINWYDFACQIFKLAEKNITVIPCSSDEYKTKARRPKRSKLIKDNWIMATDWKIRLNQYICNLLCNITDE
jgi:dTDP-4-dehydrorhamnose reductase